MFIENNANY